MNQILKKISRLRHFIAVFFLFGKLVLLAQVIPSLEYQLKAVFLFNFTQFIDWQPQSFSSDNAPLVIGVIGKNPFGNYLQSAISGEQKTGHPVTVRYCSNEAEAQACHILFINLRDSQQRRNIIEAVGEKNILTVSDAPDFVEEGGMIRFFTQNKKIKFEINLEACKAAGLEPSSKLLRVAHITPSAPANN